MKRILTLCALLAAVFTGCVPSTAQDEPFRILTSFHPIYALVSTVSANIDGVSVDVLAGPQTGCLHDYQLSTADLRKLETADVLVINGAGMEPFLDKVLAQYPDLPIIDSSKGVPLLGATSNNENFNPHIWMSLTNAMTQVDNIVGGLSAVDSAHGALYAQAGVQTIKSLRKEWRKCSDLLAAYKGRDIVIFHESLAYLADEFGLNVLSTIQTEENTQPTAAALSDTIALIKKANKDVPLFTEEQYTASAAEAIAAETGAKIYELNTMVYAGDSPETDFLDAVKQNRATLAAALKSEDA